MNLRIRHDIVIPESELEWSFDPAGGPGGQHANRSSTRAEVRFDVSTSAALSDDQRALVRRRLGRDVVVASAADTRSQWRNRRLARDRLAATLEGALAPETPRRPTRPTRGSRERRLEDKRRRAEAKRLRRRPDWE